MRVKRAVLSGVAYKHDDREHALVWKLQPSNLVSQIFVYPGNGGTESVPKVSNISLPDPSFQTLVNWAVTNDVSIHNSHFSFLKYQLRSISSFKVQKNC